MWQSAMQSFQVSFSMFSRRAWPYTLKKSNLGEPGPYQASFSICGWSAWRCWFPIIVSFKYNKTQTHCGEPGPFKVSCSIFGQRAWRWSLIFWLSIKETTKLMLASKVPSSSHFQYLASVHSNGHFLLRFLQTRTHNTPHFGEPGPFQVSSSLLGFRARC